jgi:cytochrome c556
MHLNRKFLVLAALAAAVTAGAAFTAPAPPEGRAKNLKVLPKNISHEQLDKIMDEFKDALGVKCNFCHVPAKDGSRHMDFASDEKPEKSIARSMMRMTMKINKKYFEVKHPMIGDSTLTITCKTCHRGNPHPNEIK